ncbi:MAG: peptide chain release factor 2 [Abditibacteriota bacterium]|nr:peptide chain release factor 2 [Abditibacteriota bacterium]
MLRSIYDRASEMLASLKQIEDHIDIEGIEAEIGGLEAKAGDASFWNDSAAAGEVLRRTASLKNTVEPMRELERFLSDLCELAEMVEDEFGPEAADLQTDLRRAEKRLTKIRLLTYLSGEYDANSCYLEINSGAGGTEACDWVEMLLRMYTRWAEKNDYKTELIDQTPGESAGLKSVTILVSGKYAYGYLRRESGVHRLVRISPYDAAKRRHTTFSAVEVTPEIEETGDLNVSPDEIRIDTYRSSGAGGQHVNKTDSAVRIVHIPTGIVVTCQNERSQIKNRNTALRVLYSKLAELKRQDDDKKLSQLRGDVKSIEWGNQIRSYVFQPYTMVKDHRTNIETGDVIKVMDGEIDLFIEGNLQKLK